MLEFTTHEKGVEGALAALPREPLCRVDGEEITIPVKFPAMVGLAFASLQDRWGDAAALVWAMQVALGSEAWDKLLAVGLADEDFTTLTAIVVARMQGQEAPVPAAAPAAPKARPRRTRAKAAGK